jgi:hypothetical protein
MWRFGKHPYHSALKNNSIEQLDSKDRVAINGSIAFTYDVMSGKQLPFEYDACDVLYAEIPWKHGFDIFNSRADKANVITQETKWRRYDDFLLRILQITQSSKKPTFLLVGQFFSSYLLKHNAKEMFIKYPIMLNNGKAWIYCANLYNPFNWLFLDKYHTHTSTETLISDLAQRFERVGDFMCGYGTTGRIFMMNKKKFVMSDYNSKCIGHIADVAKNWKN